MSRLKRIKADVRVHVSFRKEPILLVFMLTMFPFTSIMADCVDKMARVVSLQGTVEVRTAGESTWQPVALDRQYCQGDLIRVLDQSRLALELKNETILRLNENSTLLLSAPRGEVSWLELLKGALHTLTRVPGALKIKTPFVNAAVEGTEFVVSLTNEYARIDVIEGKVRADNDQGGLLLTGNQTAITYAGKAPVLRLDLKPLDSVQWSVYYPLIDSGLQSASLKAAQEHLRYGQIDLAEAQLRNNNSAEALALRAIIALAKNRKADALDLSAQAVQQDGKSVAARLSRSYALQANFQLEAAKAEIEQALAIDATDALIWARLAELNLSLDDVRTAQSNAQQAAQLNPDVSRTQTVLGFVKLAEFDANAAREAFRKAIAIDSSDPLPRLGIGLAQIRSGDLGDGRRQIEIAASLDPGRSLIRSYLGKAYYAEHRYARAADQFRLAKELDARDPTPWLYEALMLDTQNQPVAALDALQNSIERNDNRAVYRSELRLDQDLATRSASQARIYNKLGFSELAVQEGRDATITDPSNYAAHRMLAESYLNLPRHEVARVSEVLQAQLLQPANVIPVRQKLSESSLNLFDVVDIKTGSNEWSSLYVDDSVRIDGNALAGSQDTRGFEYGFSGVAGRISYSLGDYHYATSGFHANNASRKDSYNVFLQAQLTDDTSVQIERLASTTREGDVLRFDRNNFFSSQVITDEVISNRIGLAHALSATRKILVSIIDSQQSPLTSLGAPPFSFDSQTRVDGISTEIRMLDTYRKWHFDYGAGYASYDSSLETTFAGFPLSSEQDSFAERSLYTYAQSRNERLIWTLGASFNDFDPAILADQQFNPKLGVQWRNGGVTVSAAAFRVLKPTLTVNRTLEPTHVAGFNQFYDDPVYTDSRNYGLGFEQTLGHRQYWGVNLLSRKLDVPYVDNMTLMRARVDWEERQYRIYYYGAPRDWFTYAVSFEHEDNERAAAFPGNDAFIRAKTNRLPINLNFFIEPQTVVQFTPMYVRQEGEFIDVLTSTSAPGSDRFWTADIVLKKYLPQHAGYIAVGAQNLFDRQFMYQNTDPARPTLVPDRFSYIKLNIYF